MIAELRRALVLKATEVGALLNQVEDDDEREQLQEHYERALNDELFRGSEARAGGTVTEVDFAALVSPPTVRVIHRPLAKALRKGLRVLNQRDREGVVVGFHRRRTWTGSRSHSTAYVIVEPIQSEVRYFALPAQLRVIEEVPSSVVPLAKES